MQRAGRRGAVGGVGRGPCLIAEHHGDRVDDGIDLLDPREVGVDRPRGSRPRVSGSSPPARSRSGCTVRSLAATRRSWHPQLGVQKERGEVCVELVERVQRQHVGDVLVGTHDDQRTLLAVDAAQVEDVVGTGCPVGAKAFS